MLPPPSALASVVATRGRRASLLSVTSVASVTGKRDKRGSLPLDLACQNFRHGREHGAEARLASVRPIVVRA